MPQPQPPKVTSTPANQGQPYDATTDETGPWRKLEQNAGPANINTGRVEGGFADDGKWKQV